MGQLLHGATPLPTGSPPWEVQDMDVLMLSPRSLLSRLLPFSKQSPTLPGFTSYFRSSQGTSETLAFSPGLLTLRANGLETKTQVDT